MRKLHCLAALLCACTVAQAQFIDERSKGATQAPAAAGMNVPKLEGAGRAAAPEAKKPLSAIPLPEWNIQLADGSLSRALRRWARTAKYPLIWEAPKDLPAVAATYRAEFLEAVGLVMEDSQNSEYPLHACAYDNVVRVLHVSQSCTR